MQKYGFVYIWLDRKHKRYYIGCRWGNENDGYVCSSTWMKQAYKHRPHDFKRRILKRVYTNRKNLLEEEYKWLKQIKTGELGKRYYNMHNHHFNHWSTDPNKILSMKERMSGSNSPSFGRKHTEEWKRQAAERMKGNKYTLGRKLTEEHKKKVSQSLTGHRSWGIGFTHSEEAKRKISVSLTGEKNPFYGKKHTKEIQARISKLKSKPLITPFGRFENTKEAVLSTGMTRDQISYRVNNAKYTDWSYCK